MEGRFSPVWPDGDARRSTDTLGIGDVEDLLCKEFAAGASTPS